MDTETCYHRSIEREGRTPSSLTMVIASAKQDAISQGRLDEVAGPAS
jgi:hypothetical protein